MSLMMRKCELGRILFTTTYIIYTRIYIILVWVCYQCGLVVTMEFERNRVSYKVPAMI